MVDFIDVWGADSGGCHTPGQAMSKIGIRLFLCYLLAAYFCMEEVRFQMAVEVPAKMSVLAHRNNNKSTVRYVFNDPTDGRLHQNTVTIRTNQIPKESDVIVQYQPRTYSSRLKVQSRPWIINTFILVNATMFCAVAGMVGYFAWESHQKMPTRQQRAMAAYHKRKKTEKYQRVAHLM